MTDGARRTIQIRMNAQLAERVDRVRLRFDLPRASVLKIALINWLDRLEQELIVKREFLAKRGLEEKGTEPAIIKIEERGAR